MGLFARWGVVQTAAGVYGGRCKGVRLFGRRFVRIDVPVNGLFARICLPAEEVRSFCPWNEQSVRNAAEAETKCRRKNLEECEAHFPPLDVLPFERPGA